MRIKELLNAGVYPDVIDMDGWTPLMWAAQGGNVEIINILIEAQLDADGAQMQISDSKLAKDINTNIKNNSNKSEQNIKLNGGKVQYTITKASGHTEENPVVEKTNKRSIDPNKPMLAITYDDGPSKFTLGILDALKENNSVATFFVLGSRVYNNGDIFNRMIEEGNQIGNQ